MIRKCAESDFETVYTIINDAASAYEGVIPADRWKVPYMPRHELRSEIEAGVEFWGYEENGILVGVMGIQAVRDVTLIRHAYVRTSRRNQGVGGTLLLTLLKKANPPILIGTWADAAWAIAFYEKYGFEVVSRKEKEHLLRTYWSIPDRQIETSVVLKRSTEPI